MSVRARSCPLVIVEWVDSVLPHAGWRRLADIARAVADEKPCPMVTVGWLLRCDQRIAVIAQSIGAYDDEANVQAGGVMSIPRCCVQRIHTLKEHAVATKLGRGFVLKNGKVEKVPVFPNASAKAKHMNANRRKKKKVVRAQK